MKRALLVIFILCSLKTNAQNYLISFAGMGATNTVGSVKVENLTAGTYANLNGDDILHLTGTVGIPAFENKFSPELKFYPNPMTNYSMLDIYSPVRGDAMINIYDISGKQVFEGQGYLESGKQEFRISGIHSGFYLISIKGKTYQYSGKLLCTGKSNGAIQIEKVSGNMQSTDSKKSGMISEGTKGSTVDMEYTTGDILKCTATSGDYTTVNTLIPEEDEEVIFDFIPCTDGDDLHYAVVKIGTQTWMAENLRTARYSSNNDSIGTTIPANLDISGESMPKYQWAYDSNEINVDTYGRLYTWYAATDNRNICPAGWHLPTDEEWTTLINYLGGDFSAWAKLKETGETHWMIGSTFTTPTNESGFTALPGGHRNEKFGFLGKGIAGSWWSAKENSTSDAWYRTLDFNTDYVIRDYMAYTKKDAISIRCLKDISAP
jgi:uncharacterized protein (TIGR02145 family)